MGLKCPGSRTDIGSCRRRGVPLPIHRICQVRAVARTTLRPRAFPRRQAPFVSTPGGFHGKDRPEGCPLWPPHEARRSRFRTESVQTIRKPARLSRLPEVPPPRLAERRNLDLLPQEPLRRTRSPQSPLIHARPSAGAPRQLPFQQSSSQPWRGRCATGRSRARWLRSGSRPSPPGARSRGPSRWSPRREPPQGLASGHVGAEHAVTREQRTVRGNVLGTGHRRK